MIYLVITRKYVVIMRKTCCFNEKGYNFNDITRKDVIKMTYLVITT